MRRVAHPCYDDGRGLAGATVSLYNAFGTFVEQTVTDSDGWYYFYGLPLGRYRTEIDYPTCGRRGLMEDEHTAAAFNNDRAIKFFKSGEMCDVKVSLGGWDEESIDDFSHFDTLEECCANVFWYDMEGCFSRSHVAFEFEFCVDITGFSNDECPLSEIKTIESAMQKGLTSNSELALLEFGRAALSKVDGKTTCIAPTIIYNQDLLSNKLRGLTDHREANLSICGIVVTKESGCKEEACLRDTFDKVVVPFQSYFYSGVFSSVLHALAGDDSHPFPDLRSVEVEVSSFTTRKLLLPSTATSSKLNDETMFQYSATASDTPRFYPTYISGQLCQSKTAFDSWEQSHSSLKECCEAFFIWDFEACCSSLGMGGC